MPRILSIDYGSKRCGVAVTDPLQIIVSPLDTIATDNIEEFLFSYFKDEEVSQVVVGWPTHKDGTPTTLTIEIEKLVRKINVKFPEIEVCKTDESNTSVMAMEIMIKSGMKKKKRRVKETIDKVSAVLILQKFLNHI